MQYFQLALMIITLIDCVLKVEGGGYILNILLLIFVEVEYTIFIKLFQTHEKSPIKFLTEEIMYLI